jgi:hypothetical protein
MRRKDLPTRTVDVGGVEFAYSCRRFTDRRILVAVLERRAG